MKDSKIHLRWEKVMSDGCVRYYTADVTHDLFDSIILCSWGTVGTNRGGRKVHPITSKGEGEKLLSDIRKRREQRGYLLV